MKKDSLYLDRPMAPAAHGFFNVVVAFDDFDSGERASATLAGVVRKLRDAPTLSPSYWQFGLLDDPDRRAAALSDGRRADLLIVATSDPEKMPLPIKRWIEECVGARHGVGPRIITLFGSDNGALGLQRSSLPYGEQRFKQARAGAGICVA
jgi:hypothetical protein